MSVDYNRRDRGGRVFWTLIKCGAWVMDDVGSRLVQLESLVMHLQHDLDQVNAVVVAQQSEIDALKREIKRVESRVDQAADPESRDPLSEKPPHY